MFSELFKERTENIINAASFKEPVKVPVGFDYLNWPYRYAAKSLSELIADPKANAEAYCTFMKDIPFDFTMNTGFYEPYDMFLALGSNGYILCSDGSTVQHNQSSAAFMSDEDYNYLIKDAGKFMNEYFLRKNVPAFHRSRKEAYDKLKSAAECVSRCVKTTEYISDIAINRYSIVPIARKGIPSDGTGFEHRFGASAPFFYSPIDHLFDTYRGMMGVFQDLYDDPERLEKACDAINEYNSEHIPKMIANETEAPLPMGFSVYHAAPYLSPEQYDRFWFRLFRDMMLPFAEAGKKIYIKGESGFLHTIERFKEFPKGSIVIQLDSDDPFEAHKKIGGYQSLATGIKTSLLMLKDVSICKDYIKNVFDRLAPGGGFLLYQDRPLLSPGDADPERVLDVWRFLDEYSRQ